MENEFIYKRRVDVLKVCGSFGKQVSLRLYFELPSAECMPMVCICALMLISLQGINYM